MSTLPAASSFSGSEGSAGASGRTSRPTARKSPWAIAEYSAAWSALGKKSSITVNGLAPGALSASCFAPQPASAGGAGEHAAARHRRRRAARAPHRAGSPGRRARHGASRRSASARA